MQKTKGPSNVRRPKYIGTHLICEFFDCRGDLNSESLAKKALLVATRKSGATLISVKIHKFSPQGLTGFALLKESHISLHTWPEYGFLALDIFTCSRRMNPKAALMVFKKIYKPRDLKFSVAERGQNHRRILRGEWHADKPVRGVEYLTDATRGFIKLKKRFFAAKSQFQKIEVIDTCDFGRALILDDILQTTEKDEFIYHEMIVHPALLRFSNPRNVLVIGGGDGGALREVLKYPSLKKVYLVEIDPKVIGVCRKFLPKINQGAFGHRKAEVIFGDGAEFIKKFRDFFDAVIVDSSDPFGPAKVLFSKEFYKAVFRALRKDGALSLQGGMSSPVYAKTIKQIVIFLHETFPVVEMRLAYVPSYFGMMNFVLAAKNADKPKEIGKSFKKLRLETRYYSPEIHHASKVLPLYLAKAVGL